MKDLVELNINKVTGPNLSRLDSMGHSLFVYNYMSNLTYDRIVIIRAANPYDSIASIHKSFYLFYYIKTGKTNTSWSHAEKRLANASNGKSFFLRDAIFRK